MILPTADPQSEDVIALHARLHESERVARHAQANLAQLQQSTRDVLALNEDLRTKLAAARVVRDALSAELLETCSEMTSLKAGITSLVSLLEPVDRLEHPLSEEEDSEA